LSQVIAALNRQRIPLRKLRQPTSDNRAVFEIPDRGQSTGIETALTFW
jgi:hypothetical protein